MKAVVGSTNPVKIAATRGVLRRVYGAGISIAGLPVDSGVSKQPWGDEETLRGALNRAEAALASARGELGVGLEGGLVEIESRVFTCAWCAVARVDGAIGIGGGANLLLPPAVAWAVRAGAELGPTMDELTGLRNTKHRRGAIGILTQEYLDRQEAYEHILTLALAPLLSPRYYQDRPYD
jgi:inosine/xanthosine triphosphatase